MGSFEGNLRGGDGGCGDGRIVVRAGGWRWQECREGRRQECREGRRQGGDGRSYGRGLSCTKMSSSPIKPSRYTSSWATC